MEDFNPWWFGEEDYIYNEWKNSEVKWVPDILNSFESRPFSLNFIFGPRQVGKTTAVKIYIYEMLINSRNPKSIFYYSCDELSDYNELGEVLDTYLSARDEWGVNSSVIFLDEITFVDEWWRALKSRIDRGVLKNDVIYVLGSASVELLKGRERFPGRRGYGKDILFLPLDFNEYTRKIGGLNISSYTLEELLGDRDVLISNKPFRKGLERIFNTYMVTGGFPISIREYFTRGRVTSMSKKVYLDWIRGDIVRMGLSEKYMKEIISFLLRARLTPISWYHISRDTSINSPNTVRKYVEALEDLLVIKPLYLLSPDGRIMYRKNKKVHFIDPFIYHALSSYVKVDVYDETIVESVVASHLMRIHDIFYWKDGSEVDIVALVGDIQVGFEVKWGVKRGRKPRHITKYYILNKEVLPLFLASIKWNQI